MMEYKLMKRYFKKALPLFFIFVLCLLLAGLVSALAEEKAMAPQPDPETAYAEAVGLFVSGDFEGAKAGFDALRGAGILESWAEQFIFETDWEAARGFFADGDYASAAERLFHIENDTCAVDWVALPGIWDALILTAQKMNEEGKAQDAADLLFTVKAHIDQVSGTDGIYVRDALIGSAQYSERNGHRDVAVETLIRLFSELSGMGRETTSVVSSILDIAQNMRKDKNAQGAIELLFRLYDVQTSSAESTAEVEKAMLETIGDYMASGAYGTAYTQLYRMRDSLEEDSKKTSAVYAAIISGAEMQAASGAYRAAIDVLLDLQVQQEARSLSVADTCDAIARSAAFAADAGEYAYAFERIFAARGTLAAEKANTADVAQILLDTAVKAADGGERTLAMEALFKLRGLSKDTVPVDQKIAYVAQCMSEAKEYAPAKTALIVVNDWETMRAIVKAEQADQKEAADAQKLLDAEALFSEGKPLEARELFLSLGNYANAVERAEDCLSEADRLAAEQFYKEGSYTEAKALFVKLGSYLNAADRAADCAKGEDYLAAKAMLENGDNEAAMSGFEALGDFLDAKELLDRAREGVYSDAVAKAGSNEPAEAARLFDLVPEVMDSKERAEALRNEKKTLGSAQKGDIVLMGQKKEGSNARDIEWIVMDKNEDALLLLSRYGWNRMAYYKENRTATWDNSMIRASLKENVCFTDEEWTLILTTKTVNAKNPEYNVNGGNNTNDKLFLLSLDEVNTYFTANGERSIAKPGPDAFGTDGAWWLRTPGQKGSFAACVTADGKVDIAGRAVTESLLVRPAMWVSTAD